MIPNTKAIILYVEQIRYGRRFMETVQQDHPEKTGCCHQGRGIRCRAESRILPYRIACREPCGVLAAFRQAGVIPVNSIRGAFQTAELLASEGYPKGTRAVVITNAGGFGVLSSDYAEQNGIAMVEFSDELIQGTGRSAAT